MRTDPTPLLVEPIVRALDRVGVTQEDIFSGALQFTDLDWMAPPLASEATLAGLPFSDYLHNFLPWVDPAGLYGFWLETLAMIHTNPHRLYTEEGGWRNLSKIMPTASRHGWRKLWLPLYPGLPYVDENFGASFSIEVAHLAHLSGNLVGGLQQSESDYYGTLADGSVIGLKDGMPAVNSGFDLPVVGMVQDFLEMPRGQLWTGCDYDILAKLRSSVWEHREKLTEFEGLDLACQTLRIVTEGKGGAAIAHAIRKLRQKTEKAKLDSTVIKRCRDLMEWRGVSDARKIEGLRNMLVPAVMPLSEFRRDYYRSEEAPPFVSDKITQRIKDNLRARLMQLGELGDAD